MALTNNYLEKAVQKTIRMNLILLTFFLYQSLSAQHISVESFTKLENDMDARVHHAKKDQNAEVAALIKVVTTETGFAWDGGSLGIVDALRKTGEYWVYVPRGAQRITISHDKLGVLRNYAYPIPVEAATVYEMRLVTGRVETTVIPAELESQWLLITVEPSTALIYLDDKFEATGTLSKKLLPGAYTYRVEAPLYHTDAGKITITSEKKEELKLKMNPNFGYIEVKTTPETGARVMINNREAGFVTNGTSDKLQSGNHTVTVIKEQFQPVAREVTVSDGQTTAITLDMAPNFATVSVTLPDDATLYINNEQKSRGNWSGRLNAGVYTLEARKDKHKTAKQDIQLQAGDTKTANLEPIPITGSIDVVSTPPQAKIKLNGKDYGTTPNTIRSLLIGEYTVTLERQGYATVSKNITVSEGGSTLINETLPAGMKVTITSEPAGADLFIDNQKAGTTPYTGELGFGSHNIKLVNNTKTIQETISITQGGRNDFSFKFPADVKIGDRAHGGIVFYLDGKGGGLVCAENDQGRAKRGCYGKTIGGTITGIGTGAANTAKIVAGCNQTRIAARICNDLVLNGYSDWFLPSKDELDLMYKNLKNKGVGGFAADGYYWSSSLYDKDSAWTQHFRNGNQYSSNFLTKTLVRAVRAF